MPPSSTNGSDSKSRKMSPSDGSGSRARPRFGLCRKELVNRISCVAILELKAGLLVRVRESGQRGDAGLLQFPDLMFGDSRYEG